MLLLIDREINKSVNNVISVRCSYYVGLRFFLVQNEKRHMLMESETTKLKERDEKHATQVVAWKAELGPRKKVRDSLAPARVNIIEASGKNP